ncbi:MAG: ABC transporter substrate-binding protein [Spirochaetales bacterium]|nr:ABC transporter substrate-binding protein [Spirochaetales bacterium]
MCVLFALILTLSSCGEQNTSKPAKIVFADVSWDSVQVHNRIAAFIISKGLGDYEVEFVSGDTLPLFNGLTLGDVDVNMESWHSNFPEAYEKAIQAGTVKDLGKNIPDAPQGWWIPRYILEGDSERGIEASAPDLKHINDLPKYWQLFKDPEDSSKGVVYLGAAGWSSTITSEEFFDGAGLGDTYNSSAPGSGAALAASMVGAYEKGEPWVGYYWAPTAVLGRLDMVRLEGSEFPPADVHILMNAKSAQAMPEVAEFLSRYATTVADNNLFLAMMEENGWGAEETAQWFLSDKQDVWTQWVDEAVAEKVLAAL